MSMSRSSPSSALLARGVGILPFLGPNGETVLVRVDHQHRIIGELIYVPTGGNHVAVGDAAWDDVDRVDPIYLRVI